MGLSRSNHERLLAGLKPIPVEPEPDEQEVEVDRSGFMDPDVMRGFPMMDGKHGLPGGGAIGDTRPGGEIGAAARLEKQIREEARDLNGKARELIRGQLRRTRVKDQRDKDTP